MRYLISLVIIAAGGVFTILVQGGSVGPVFLDIPALIAVGLIPFLFVSTLFGFKGMRSAFSTPVKKEPERDKLLRALNFFKIYGKATWVAGITAVLCSLILMLYHLEDAAALGPNIALSLIFLLYSGVINMVLIIPFTIFIKKHLKE